MNNYSSFKITPREAEEIAIEDYGFKGIATALPGEIDFNFKLAMGSKSCLLKISRPGFDPAVTEFQEALLKFLEEKDIATPKLIKNKAGESSFEISDRQGNSRLVRMLTWIEGRLWSQVRPHSEALLFSLGQQAGALTRALQSFNHDFAHRRFDWDIAQLPWVKEHLSLFETEQRSLIEAFLRPFEAFKKRYDGLPKSVVHNDVNDNNIIVTHDFTQPGVEAIIDFGDAVFTQTINDLAITIAYAAMDKPDPLEAACAVVRGYATKYQPGAGELEVLSTLVAARLIISVTKSAINRQQEPENEYLLVSEKPAWDLLKKWARINPNLAYYSFRQACGLPPHPQQKRFGQLAGHNQFSINALIPDAPPAKVLAPDLGIDSHWAGSLAEQDDIDLLTHKLKVLQRSNPEATLAGGYGECRSIYTTEAYQIETNNGPEYRSLHLGVDFWFAANTEIHTLFDGRVFSLYDNDRPKDYGVTLILEHEIDGLQFYSLYGHLGRKTMELLQPGQEVKEGQLVAYLGNVEENGGWSPHLHFQLMLDMLSNTTDFPGVTTYRDREVWQGICPDPGLLFKEEIPRAGKPAKDLLDFRRKHLGKGLSLSYNEPLNILRGAGAWLIDDTGRRYLDTVNNVAHVGHEHPEVVRAGQRQMAVLNTNTRYLNKHINQYTKELLKTFPEELSVVHFVNSGSEANELALRMARTVSGEKDMLAMQVGYHGNTSGCIEVSSYKFDGRGGSGCPPHTHLVPLPDRYRGIYQGSDTGGQYAGHVAEEIAKVQAAGRNIAGFIGESIISCGGQIELPKSFLPKAYEEVRRAGGLCIADEVQVGFARVGAAFWGFQLHEVIPDIVTVGKPMGNGHPLAAVICTREVAEAFANGMEYFNTFGGNPVSAVIGKTVLEVIQKENLQENALQVGNYLKQQLRNLQQEFPIIGDVRGQGLFLGFELNKRDKSPLPEQATYLANRMKELGILMSTDGPDHNVLKIKPPMVFSMANADELVNRLEQVLAEDFMVL